MKKVNNAQAVAIDTTAQVAANETPTASNEGNIGTVTVMEAFKAANVAVTAKAEQSATMQQAIRQQLAEAKDLLSQGDGKAKEARSITAVAALSLYQGRIAGLFSNEQINGLLGDQFGYKQKQDGTASKTPDGEGEAIRKRVMRMTQAHDFVVSDEATKFFEPLDKAEVASVLAALESGMKPIYTAYDDLSELSRKAKETVPTAFNPKAILKLVDTLTSQPIAAVEAFTGEQSADLITAYQALIGAFELIMTAPADLPEQDLPIG